MNSPVRQQLRPLVELAARRRQFSRRVALAAVAAVALVSLVLLAVLDTCWTMPGLLRWAVVVLAGVLAAGWVFDRWRRAGKRHTELEAAGVIEASDPQIGQRLRTALELGNQPPPLNESGGLADEFRRRLMTESGATLESSSWRDLVPTRLLQRWLLGIAGAVGLIVLLLASWPDFRLGLARILMPGMSRTYTELDWVAMPSRFDDRNPPLVELRTSGRAAEPVFHVREIGGDWETVPLSGRPDGKSWDAVLTGRVHDLEVYATAGDARTAVSRIAYRPVPKLLNVEVSMFAPDYIGGDPVTQNGGDIAVVEGSEVTWTFTFDRRPDQITWVMGEDDEQPLFSNDDAIAATSWVAKAGVINTTLTVLDEHGERQDSWRFTAEGVPDALPKVKIIEPSEAVEATSVAELPVRIRAEDDYGISELGLVLEAGGEREWVLKKVVLERGETRVDQLVTAMLEKFPLSIRDNVRLYAYALDHKPRGGARALSKLRAIDIRQFKIRYFLVEGEGLDAAQLTKALTTLNELIGLQRDVVSEAFVQRGPSTNGLTQEAIGVCADLSVREMDIGRKTYEFEQSLSEMNAVPRDDRLLLEVATSQMEEATTSFTGKRLERAFNSSDRALTNLLQLRKKILVMIMKSEDPSESSDGDSPEPLFDLAAEARRLAKEEADIIAQVEVAEGSQVPPAAGRQQEVARADGGELYAKLIAHPERTDGALKLMDEAEQAMIEADDTIHSDEFKTSLAPLALAVKRLNELADFLEAMELERLSETLRELAEKAESNAESGSEPKDEPGSEPGSEGEEKRAEQMAKAARDAELADEILKALAKKAAGEPGEQPGTSDSPSTSLGEALAELRKKAGAGELAEDLAEAATAAESDETSEGKKGGGGESNEQGSGGFADRLQEMAQALREFADRQDASRLSQLAEAKGQAGEARAEAEGEGTGGEEPKDFESEADGGQLHGSPTGRAQEDFTNSLKALGDKVLEHWAKQLESGPSIERTVKAIDSAEQRIDQLIEEMPDPTANVAGRGQIPEDSRRVIEDYFRDLSDDFGGETWGTKE